MESNYGLIGLLLVIIQINRILAGDDTARLSEEDVGQKLYGELFRVSDRVYTSLTPHDTLENLKRLVAIYNSNSFDIGKPAYSTENQSLVRGLLNTFMDQSCSKENIIKYNEYLNSLSVYGNITRALKLYRDERFKKCLLEYPKPLFKTISAMSYEDRRGIVILHDEILQQLRLFNWDKPFYTGEAFNKGVLFYLSKNPGAFREEWKKAKMLSKPDLASLYDEQVISLCSRLGEDFYKEADFFLKTVATDSVLAKINNGPSRYWMISAYICQDASRRRQEIIDQIYELMYEYAHPKRRGLFKWIRDENKILREMQYR